MIIFGDFRNSSYLWTRNFMYNPLNCKLCEKTLKKEKEKRKWKWKSVMMWPAKRNTGITTVFLLLPITKDELKEGQKEELKEN